MGFRTTVILYNDQCHEWQHDPKLGEKIANAMSSAMYGEQRNRDAEFGYGRVIECAHADTQLIGVLDSYHFKPLGFGNWRPNEPDAERDLRMVKEAAARLGYRLVKKS